MDAGKSDDSADQGPARETGEPKPAQPDVETLYTTRYEGNLKVKELNVSKIKLRVNLG